MKQLRLMAVVMALAVVFSMAALPASAALDYDLGTKYDGIGTFETIEGETSVAGIEGFDYSKAVFKDIAKKGQTMHVMEFNPATTDLIPMVYQPKPSYGYRVAASVADATAKGYEVVGAINGEFFSMNTENYGSLTGRMITNGRIIVDSEDCDQVCLAIDSNGAFSLVQSKTKYSVKIDGTPVKNGAGMISKINGRFVGKNWWDPWMYFDYATGGKTYTNENVKGVEVVFDKLDGTELMIESTLKGKVVSVNKDTYATPMTENQFVLYAQSTSANYATLANLTVGQEIEIFADELNKDAEAAMKNAMTVSAATYPIVMNGENNIANIKDEGGLVAAKAQRTNIGIKEDGTIVMMVSDGRGTSAAYNYGLTLEKVASMFIAMGCKYAVALDGGGSSNMWVDGETKFETNENGYVRPVGSTILVCKRNEAVSDPAKKEELKAVIDEATALTPESNAKKTALEAALAEANAAYENANAATADYLREAIDLKAVMAMEDTDPTEPTTTTTSTTVVSETTTTAPATTTVPKPDNSQNSPNTADHSMAMVYVLVALMAASVALSVGAFQKKAAR